MMHKDVSNILKNIDSIDTCCLEASHDVSNTLLEYEDKTNTILEYFETVEPEMNFDVEYVALEQCYNEFEKQCVIQESVGSAIRGFFSKALEMIKGFFAFIIKQGKRLFNFLFRRNAKATPDQIAESMGINPQQSGATTYNTNADKATPPEPKEKPAKQPKKNETVTVDFPASADSKIPATKLKLMAKSIVTKIENDSYVIGTPEGFAGDAEHIKRNDVYKGVGTNMGITFMRNQQINIFLAYVENRNGYRDTLDKLLDQLVQAAKKYPNGKLPNEQVVAIVNLINDFVMDSDKQTQTGWEYTVDQETIMKYQKEANDVIRKLNSIDTIGENQDPKYTNAIKKLMNVLNHLTMGCNQLGNELPHMFMIDAKYLHSISDVSTLGKFVDEMVKANIPSKQVAYNTWCVMSKNFDNRKFFAYEKGGDYKPPRWGQTRVVFFPTDKPNEVLKIAMNQAGILGNKREFQLYNIYNKHSSEDILARPIKKYGDYALITMEKLSCPEEGYSSEAIRLTNTVRKIINDNPGIPEIGDIHAKNVGKDERGKYKIIDYAG